jgi:hypothetical protein
MAVLAVTLPGLRTLLMIMTIVGGLLSFVASGWVARLSRKDRCLRRNLDRLGDQYQRELTLHSREYQAYGTGWLIPSAAMGQHPFRPSAAWTKRPTTTWSSPNMLRRVQARTGRDPMQPESDKDVHRDVLSELYRPALLAGLGVLLSTTASALLLYLPPNV